MTNKCSCGGISTVIAKYKDGTVEPCCESCLELKKNYIPAYDSDEKEIVAGDTILTTWGNEYQVIMKDNQLTCVDRESEPINDIIDDYMGVWIIKRDSE